MRRTIVTIVTLALAWPAAAVEPAGRTTVTPEEAAELARDVYVFGYPLVTMAQTRAVMTNVVRAASSRAPVNQLANLREYPSASFRDVTAPNADTLYSTAWLDLAREPMVFSYPDMGKRYFMFPLLDGYTEELASPGARTTGGQGQIFLIVGPSWRGTPPAGMKVVKSPTNMVWLLGRTYCKGTQDDYRAVHALQDQYKLVPLHAWGKSYTPPLGEVDPHVDMKTAVRTQVERMTAEKFFALLARLMKDNPPPPADAPMVAKMAKLGLVPGHEFSLRNLDPASARAIAEAPRTGLRAIAEQEHSGASVSNGWTVMLETGRYGTDYLQRAFVARIGLGANVPEDAVYPFTQRDRAARPLSGANRYVIRFPAGRLPPVKGFWSITMYNPEYFFVANALDKYTVSPRDDLHYNDDGSLELYVQSAPPPAAKQSNWLPAPKGNFVLMMRMYWPNPSPPTILDGSWRPPLVERSGARLGRRSEARP